MSILFVLLTHRLLACYYLSCFQRSSLSKEVAEYHETAMDSLYSGLASSHRQELLMIDIFLASYPHDGNLKILRNRTAEAMSFLCVPANGPKPTLESRTSRESFLLLSMIGSEISFEYVAKIILKLLEDIQKGSSVSDATSVIALAYIKSRASKPDPGKYLNPLVLRQTFEMWWSLSTTRSHDPPQVDARLMIACYLAPWITSLFEAKNFDSLVLFSVTQREPEDAVIDKLLALIVLDPIGRSISRILIAIMEYDGRRYIPCFVSRFNKGCEKVMKPWHRGFLYDVMLVVIRNHDVTTDAAFTEIVQSVTEWCAHILSLLVSYFRRSLERHITPFLNSRLQNDRKMPANVDELLALLNEVLRVSMHKNHVEKPTLEKLTLELVRLFGGLGQVLIELNVMLVYEAGVTILKLQDSVQEKKPGLEMASVVFSDLCHAIIRSLKKHTKSNLNRRESRVMDEPQMYFDWIFDVLSNEGKVHLGVVQLVDISVIRILLRSCLKYGITDQVEANQRLPVLSLKLVRLILTASLASAEASHLGVSVELIPLATEVFWMTTSHSRFHQLLSNDSECLKDVKIEMIKLLDCCASLSPEKLKIERETWKAVFGTFEAGFSPLDTAIRHFFESCERSVSSTKLERRLLCIFVSCSINRIFSGASNPIFG